MICLFRCEDMAKLNDLSIQIRRYGSATLEEDDAAKNVTTLACYTPVRSDNAAARIKKAAARIKAAIGKRSTKPSPLVMAKKTLLRPKMNPEMLSRMNHEERCAQIAFVNARFQVLNVCELYIKYFEINSHDEF